MYAYGDSELGVGKVRKFGIKNSWWRVLGLRGMAWGKRLQKDDRCRGGIGPLLGPVFVCTGDTGFKKAETGMTA